MIDPDTTFPMAGFEHTAFLRPLLATKSIGNISVGAYTYYSDLDSPLGFFERNVRYNFGRSGARLEFGTYCAIAHGAVFVMADANHTMGGPSTYPFPVFGGDWAERMPLAETPFINKGSTIIGHDVWIGMEAAILPGVTIGNGAIIGTRAVVADDIPDYAIAVGNPATVKRLRFPENDVDRLNRLAWWQWDPAHVTACVPLLITGSVGELHDYAAAHGLI